MDTEFIIDLPYFQIAVFDAALSKPYNTWTKPHLQQGFAWREGSVSFAVVEDGPTRVTISTVNRPPQFDASATRIIRVPFQAASGIIEVGSVISTHKLTINAKHCNLWFALLPAESEDHDASVELTIDTNYDATPVIFKQDSLLKPATPLLMGAAPA